MALLAGTALSVITREDGSVERWDAPSPLLRADGERLERDGALGGAVSVARPVGATIPASARGARIRSLNRGGLRNRLARVHEVASATDDHSTNSAGRADVAVSKIRAGDGSARRAREGA